MNEQPAVEASRTEPPQDTQPEPRRAPPVAMACAADPSVETYLRCGRCDTPICPRCMIHTPVGARCKACARLRKLPMFELGPLDYARAIGGGVGAAYVAGFILTLVQSMMPFLGFLGLLLVLGYGYVVGEAVSQTSRRKRGTRVGVIAALAVPLGLVLARATLFVLGGAFPVLALQAAALMLLAPLWNLLGVAVAMGLAYSRAR
ncbi:MAG: hypothetical protein IT305_16110 [Chloroflexi bacterium]|nr:hypothetical protein [Chloroflexota bacterium]